MKKRRYYVYIYFDPRSGKESPIYVGKGCDDRCLEHLEHAQNPFLRKVISKIRKAGLEPRIEKIKYFYDELKAFKLEKTLIAKFGRRDLGKGTLCNLTDGGDGVCGFIFTEKHREAAKVLWQDKIVRGKRISSLKEFYRKNSEVGAAHNETMLASHTPEVKRKIVENSKRALSKLAIREKISASLKKHYSGNAEALQRLSAQGKKSKGKKLSEETKEKMSAVKKAQFKDPEFRKKWSESTFSLEAECKRAETRNKSRVSD